MESGKMVEMNLLPKQKYSHLCREQIYGYQRGKGEWDESEDWDWHVTPVYMYKTELIRIYSIE